MAFKHLKQTPKDFKFIANGCYSAYPLATQQFCRESEGSMKFDINQVIGLTNDDAVSTKYSPLKQMIERLNRTYKQSYRPTNCFDNIDVANYDLALWVTYYNFLRPHKEFKYKPPIQDPGLAIAGNFKIISTLLILTKMVLILLIQSKIATSVYNLIII